MARGSKSAYTDKQKRKAAHIESGYRKKGVSKDTAQARAWATVNKDSGGGNKSGSGRGVPDMSVAARRKRGQAKPASRFTRTPGGKTASSRTRTKRSSQTRH